jgi:O-methyltransferase
MDNSFIPRILESCHMLNIEEEMNIYHLLSQAVLLDVPGDVVELGCFDGRTAAIMQKTLDEVGSKKLIHVFDSFDGLPAKSKKDGNTPLKKGRCWTVPGEVTRTFARAGLRHKAPVIHKGWFKDTLPTQLPERICFAHLDGDFYESVKDSLENVYPRLSPRAVVVIDDYCEPTLHKEIEDLINENRYSLETGRKITIKNLLPGVKEACDEFLSDKTEKVYVLIAGEERQGYFRKDAGHAAKPKPKPDGKRKNALSRQLRRK